MNQKNCNNCKKDFQIYPEDREMYGRFQVPEPTWCPECRMIRRMVFRNERALYKRKCDKCQAEKIFMYPVRSKPPQAAEAAPNGEATSNGMYPADAPFPVYCYECWWGDGWDPKSYARDYDFNVIRKPEKQ